MSSAHLIQFSDLKVNGIIEIEDFIFERSVMIMSGEYSIKIGKVTIHQMFWIRGGKFESFNVDSVTVKEKGSLSFLGGDFMNVLFTITYGMSKHKFSQRRVMSCRVWRCKT